MIFCSFRIIKIWFSLELCHFNISVTLKLIGERGRGWIQTSVCLAFNVCRVQYDFFLISFIYMYYMFTGYYKVKEVNKNNFQYAWTSNTVCISATHYAFFIVLVCALSYKDTYPYTQKKNLNIFIVSRSIVNFAHWLWPPIA
jgi:hypothetical protein